MDVIIHLVKPTECTTKNVQPRTNIGVTYGLGMIMMCQQSFILGKKKKVTILVSEVGNRVRSACDRAGIIWENSIPSYLLNFVVKFKLCPTPHLKYFLLLFKTVAISSKLLLIFYLILIRFSALLLINYCKTKFVKLRQKHQFSY